jgi:hypothetical protein
MYDSPQENICQGVKVLFCLGPRGARPVPLYAIWGTPVGHFFGYTTSRCVCTVTVQRLPGNFAPTAGPKARQSAQKVSQRILKAFFSELRALLLGAIAAKSALCTNSTCNIYCGSTSFYGSRALPFHPQYPLRTAMCTSTFLLHSFIFNFGVKVTSKVPPRQAQGVPKRPQGSQKLSPGHLKTIKKLAWDPTWAPKDVRKATGVPPEGK